jgi:copper chaperone
MKYAFKTDINCIGCVNQIKPKLDKLEQTKEIEHWRVDLNNPDYLLTVETNAMTGEDVQSVIQNAGFKAQMLPA